MTKFRVRLFTGMDRNGLNYRNGLPKWTFICGFECLLCMLYAQNDIHLDFCKAFDKVPHKRLLKKLWGYGIRGNVHAWVKDFLTNRSQLVKINDASSEPVNVTSGVPQGSVLGPILFLIYINDLADTISAIIKLFADNVKVYRSISTVENVNHRFKIVIINQNLGLTFGRCYSI